MWISIAHATRICFTRRPRGTKMNPDDARRKTIYRMCAIVARTYRNTIIRKQNNQETYVTCMKRVSHDRIRRKSIKLLEFKLVPDTHCVSVSVAFSCSSLLHKWTKVYRYQWVYFPSSARLPANSIGNICPNGTHYSISLRIYILIFVLLRLDHLLR